MLGKIVKKLVYKGICTLMENNNGKQFCLGGLLFGGLSISGSFFLKIVESVNLYT